MHQKRVFLISGRPGSGKTTAIRKVIAQLKLPAGGFYTQEIREAGRRVGFELSTLEGQKGVLAHVKLQGQPRIGKYGVDMDVLESIGLPALRRGIEAKVLVVDEIGPMEILSRKFQEVVWEALESDVLVLGSIARRSTPFTDAIKKRGDVAVFEITLGNRNSIAEEILTSARAVLL